MYTFCFFALTSILFARALVIFRLLNKATVKCFFELGMSCELCFSDFYVLAFRTNKYDDDDDIRHINMKYSE